MKAKTKRLTLKNFKWLGRGIGGCYRDVLVVIHNTKGGIPKTGGAYHLEFYSISGKPLPYIVYNAGEEGFDPDEIETYCEVAIDRFIDEDGRL